MQRIPPLAALTYVRMVCRQHATHELQHPFKHGKRIRVRVGPFTDRAEADKAAEKIKSIKFDAAVLTL